MARWAAAFLGEEEAANGEGVVMERSETGAFQKVMRTAETESDSFGASGSGPMHEKLRALYDNALRAYPGLEADEAFAMAWRDLSLSDRAQIRDEESGEWQRQQAEAARFRESSIRADGREKENTTMKHEPVRLLLKALHGVYADEELTQRERGEVVADVLDDYADRTGGRDGLKDIASIPAALDEPDLTKADTRHALAMAVLEGKAEALRKVNPSLTREQAFSRVYTDPSNAEIAQIERAANEARFAEQATSLIQAITCEKRLLVAKRDNALDALKAKAAELRKANPALTKSQAFAKVYGDPANRALAAAERQSARRLCTPKSEFDAPLSPPGRFRRDSGAGGTYPAAGASFLLTGK